MRSIENALPRRDGVRAFTRLYRAVTEDVDRGVRPATFADAPFARWLDVVLRVPAFPRAPRALPRPETAAAGLGCPLRGARSARRGADPVRARGNERAHQSRPAARARHDLRGPEGGPHARCATACRLPADRPRARRDGGPGQGGVRDRPRRLGRTKRSASSTTSSRCGTCRRARRPGRTRRRSGRSGAFRSRRAGSWSRSTGPSALPAADAPAAG